MSHKKSKKTSNNNPSWLCSGYGVAPSGKKCKGCIDCGWGKRVMNRRQINKSIGDRVVVIDNNKPPPTRINKQIKKQK